MHTSKWPTPIKKWWVRNETASTAKPFSAMNEHEQAAVAQMHPVFVFFLPGASTGTGVSSVCSLRQSIT